MFFLEVDQFFLWQPSVLNIPAEGSQLKRLVQNLERDIETIYFHYQNHLSTWNRVLVIFINRLATPTGNIHFG